MELTNKRTAFNFTHASSDGDLSANGQIEIRDNRLTSLTFQINSQADGFIGNAYYSELENGTINKNFNNMVKGFDADPILDEIVEAIHEQTDEPVAESAE